MSSRDEPSITRSSLRRKANSVPATPSTPITADLGESTSTQILLYLFTVVYFYTGVKCTEEV